MKTGKTDMRMFKAMQNIQMFNKHLTSVYDYSPS